MKTKWLDDMQQTGNLGSGNKGNNNESDDVRGMGELLRNVLTRIAAQSPAPPDDLDYEMAVMVASHDMAKIDEPTPVGAIGTLLTYRKFNPLGFRRLITDFQKALNEKRKQN